MSKNFELLQRVAKDDYFQFTGAPAPHPPKTRFAISSRNAIRDTEITKLVQRLFSKTGADVRPRIVSFSGIERDNGSSWICARAGEILAGQSGASVCVVDANLGSPQLHVHLGVANPRGLAEAVTTKDPIRDFALPLRGMNLWLIPSGVGKPGAYTFTDGYRERFAELREAFDYILISAPDLSHETQATVVGQLMDGIVLVVEANRTRRETIRRVKEQLESAHVRVLGAVLDQRTFPIPEKLYHRL